MFMLTVKPLKEITLHRIYFNNEMDSMFIFSIDSLTTVSYLDANNICQTNYDKTRLVLIDTAYVTSPIETA